MGWDTILAVVAIALSLPGVCANIFTLIDKYAEHQRYLRTKEKDYAVHTEGNA